MCTVCSAECIVNIDLSHGSQFLRESGIVLLLFLVETNVLEQHSLAALELGSQLLSVLTNDVLSQLYFLAEQLGQALCNRCQRVLHLELTLRAAQMRAQNNSSVMLEQILDGRQCSDDTLVVGDAAGLVLRDIEIAANDNLLARNVNILYALLVVIHK